MSEKTVVGIVLLIGTAQYFLRIRDDMPRFKRRVMLCAGLATIVVSVGYLISVPALVYIGAGAVVVLCVGLVVRKLRRRRRDRRNDLEVKRR
jgi:energy-converting hydrogenase Eha subunit C